MSETKHTPGPWKLEREHDGFKVIGPRQGCKRNGKQNSWELASVGDDVFWDDVKFKAEDKANARLIAAAPDLLATMKQAADIMRRSFGHQNEKLADVEPLLRAAIAKATGASA